MSEIIDRAARAAYEAYYANSVGLGGAGWDNETEQGKHVARAQVRAVLEAIREPTEAMLFAAGKGRGLFYEIGDPEMAYRAMIDAALGEQP